MNVVLRSNTTKDRLGKRLVDIAVALPLAIVTFPLVVLMALGSTMAYRAWPFFTQRRVGRLGNAFRCVKVRTLPTHAPRHADRSTIEHHIEGWWGRFLRNTHLDELPQLWQVVGGTMSLVGPRPVILEHSDTFEPTFVRLRLTMRPGLTGLWQLSPYADEPIGDHPEFDLHYVERHTMRLDLWLILRTAWFLIGGSHALTLDRIPEWTAAALSATPADCVPDSSGARV